MSVPPRAMSAASASRLRRLVQGGAAVRTPTRPDRLAGPVPGRDIDPEQERCELCAQPIPAEHQHLLDLERRELLCGCRACALLFDRREAGGGRYRLVPDRVLLVADFELDDLRWQGLRIPVDMAFFFSSSAVGRVAAFYPGPMGATESLLELADWAEIEAQNPVLASMEPDVEALLVNRAAGARDHWLVPVDQAYALVGLFRTSWRGLAGGEEVWAEIARFFDGLRDRARVVSRDGTRVT